MDSGPTEAVAAALKLGPTTAPDSGAPAKNPRPPVKSPWPPAKNPLLPVKKFLQGFSHLSTTPKFKIHYVDYVVNYKYHHFLATRGFLANLGFSIRGVFKPELGLTG
ncbi:hypothetical protein RRF57_001667 [Xylaria bambusicola]|uniref:Uncharacterized protein n=1 Tax=Xylaria bambusicola TaxID=326684 RepID=A0AAN7UHK7_9PEZI